LLLGSHLCSVVTDPRPLKTVTGLCNPCMLCSIQSPFPLPFPDCNLTFFFPSFVLVSEILEPLGEGLKLGDTGIFSRLIRDSKSDTLLRLNLYPAAYSNSKEDDYRIGFGENTDPQILTHLDPMSAGCR